MDWLWRIGMFLGLAALSGVLPVGPALAVAPASDRDPIDPGPGFVLIDTHSFKQFIPSGTPPATLQDPGAGWVLVDSQSVAYFVGDVQVADASERLLESSTTLSVRTQKRKETRQRVRITGRPSVKLREYTEVAGRSTQRDREGPFLTEWEVGLLDRVREETSSTPYADVDQLTYEERQQKTLKNVYKKVRSLAFADPYTGDTVYSELRELETPVEEIVLTDWAEKMVRTPIGEGVEVATAKTRIGQETTRRLLRRTLTSAGTSSGLASVSLLNTGSQQVAYSGNDGAGVWAGRAMIGTSAERLTGATQVQAVGEPGNGTATHSRPRGQRDEGGDFDALLQAASRGLDLRDENGIEWLVVASRGALSFSSGETHILVGRHQRRAMGSSGSRVEIRGMRVMGGQFVLYGEFRPAGGRRSSTLTGI